MKICIFGAGAVGSHLAAGLARAGCAVSMVARGAHLQAVRERGLRFISPDDDYTVQLQATDRPQELGPQDLVVTTLKAQSLPGVADGIAALLGSDTPIVYAANGVPWWFFHGMGGAHDGHRLDRLDPGGRLWDGLGVERAIGCVIRSPNEVVEPGVVRCFSASSRFILGEPGAADSPRLQRAVQALGQGVKQVEASANIRLELWDKLVLNQASSPIACLAHATTTDIGANPALAELFCALVDEGRAVGASLGLNVSLDPHKEIARFGKLAHKASMLQDLLAGRAMELDAQLVAVQDLARLQGVPTPRLDMVLGLLVTRARALGLYPAQAPAGRAAAGDAAARAGAAA